MSKPKRASEQLSYCTVRIESRFSNGDVGTGTGFLFAFLKEGNSNIPCIITNKHVVEGASSVSFFLNKADDQSNRLRDKILVNYQNFIGRWLPHPVMDVDLCVLPIGPELNQLKEKGITTHMTFLDSSIIPTPQQWSDLTALEDIIMIGYPNGIWDFANNLPIIRKGITATHPNIDYDDKKQFLIDAAVFPGSSGSPVLIFNEGSYPTSGGIALGTRVMLLGINFAVFQHDATGQIIIEEIPTKQKTTTVSSIPNNLGLVIKSIRLLEFEPILQSLKK